ncbi:hypothetical protein MnTg02_01124 [bacterium MnTg02]|nr:hypothetical protein MnTg02_01124 [bacterium MnTg02]
MSRILTVSMFFLLLGFSVDAAQAEKRLALIITNQDYPVSIGRLGNTHHDGQIIAHALQRVGFEVHVVRDVDKSGFLTAVSAYVRRLDLAGPDSVGFFYYSGHGAARDKFGDNFLIPIKAPIKSSVELPLLGIKLGDVIESLSLPQTKANFVVIDACRNVILRRNTKSVYKGFAPEKERGGMLIAYATEPGNIAVDENVYARALAAEIMRPNRPAVLMFRAVRRRVLRATRNKQFPWTRDGLVDEFYFGKQGPATGADLALPSPSAASETTTAALLAPGQLQPGTLDSVHKFDGKWRIKKRFTVCVARGSGIIDLEISKSKSLTSGITGTVSSDGKFAFRKKMSKRRVGEYSGQIAGGSGQGKFRHSDKNYKKMCQGTFTIERPVLAAQPSPSPSVSMVVSSSDKNALEFIYWDAIKNSTNIDELQSYMQRFPEGTFRGLVAARIKGIRKSSSKKEAANASEARRGKADQVAALPPVRNSAFPFDGAWRISRSGTGCRRNAGTFVVKITKGKMKSMFGSHTGSVSKSGKVSMRSGGKEGRYLSFSGTIKNTKGKGSYRGKSRRGTSPTCRGSFTMTRASRS